MNKMLAFTLWDKRHENAKSRQLDYLSWVPIPNYLLDDRFLELMDHPQGPAHFGIYIAMVMLASSRRRPRGALCRRDGTPQDVDSIARMINAPRELVRAAIERLLSPSIGLLVEEEWNGVSPTADESQSSPFSVNYSPELIQSLEQLNMPPAKIGGKQRAQLDELVRDFGEDLVIRELCECRRLGKTRWGHIHQYIRGKQNRQQWDDAARSHREERGQAMTDELRPDLNLE